jgi:hypothetical protein
LNSSGEEVLVAFDEEEVREWACVGLRLDVEA